MWLPEIFERDVFDGVNQLKREMNRLFNNYAPDAYRPYPAVNIWSKDDEVMITAELPGFDPSGIDVSVQGLQLTIQGERKANEMSAGVVCHRRERGSGGFVRTIRLPYEADESKVKATFKNGVLSIAVPRAEQSKPKKIKVLTE